MFATALVGLSLLLARDSLASEVVPLPEGSIARLGRGEVWGTAALSADGTRLAVRSRYGLWLRDGHTGEEIARLGGATDGLRRSLAFSRTGPSWQAAARTVWSGCGT